MKKKKGWLSGLFGGERKAAADVAGNVVPTNQRSDAPEDADGTVLGTTTILPNEATPLAEAASVPPPAGFDTPSNNLSDAEASVPLEWAVGDVILDLYEVTDRFESGAMGLVYRVRHKGWGIDLAVKAPRREIFARDGGQAAFVREAETWVKLGLHPNVVTCHHVRSLGGVPRVFAEFVAGGSLKEWMAGNDLASRLYEGDQGQALARMLDIAIQFAWGLGFAHEQGLVHRDVKPANVMLTPEGIVKVCDFGLARAQEASSGRSVWQGDSDPLKTAGGLTPAYASSEQLAGKALTASTDVWSWAVSILEMFVGEVTWLSGSAAGQALEAYLENESNNSSIPPMPHEMAKILQLCLAADPNDRPTCLVIADELGKLYEQLTGNAYPRDIPIVSDAISDTLNNKALSLMDLGRSEEAEHAWQRALEVDPQHLETIYNWGVVRWRQSKITDDVLVNQLKNLPAKPNGDWERDFLLALVHLERNDVDAALLLLEKAAQQTASNAVHDALTNARLITDGSARCLQTIHASETHISHVSYVALSPDDEFVWSLTTGGLEYWKLSTGQRVKQISTYPYDARSVNFSKDGNFALTTGQDSPLTEKVEKICLWDMSTGRRLRDFDGHTDLANSVYLGADAQFALSGSNDKTLKLWEVSTGRCIRTLEGHTDNVSSVVLSSNERFALSGSRDKAVRFWELATGRCLRKLEGHTHDIRSVALSSDDRFALSGCGGGTLKLWELSTGRCLRTFEKHRASIRSVCLSADGNFALSGGNDHTVRLWEISTGRCLHTYNQGEPVTSVCISSDSCYAVSGCLDMQDSGTIKYWTVPDQYSNFCEFRIVKPRTFRNLSDDFLRVSSELAKMETAIRQHDYPYALKLMDNVGQTEGLEWADPVRDARNQLSLYCQKVELRTAWLQTTFNLSDTDNNYNVVLSADHLFVLSSDEDLNLRYWEVKTGRCLRTFHGHTDFASSICLSADGQFALSGSIDKVLKLWEVATGHCLRTFEGHTDRVDAVCFSPDGRLALSGSKDRTIILWELSTGRRLRTFSEHDGAVKSVSFSFDSCFALSGVFAKTSKLWEISTGRCIRTFSTNQKWDGQYIGVSMSVCMSADGRYAVIGTAEDTIQLWEISTGLCVQIFEGHISTVNSVCMSADGNYVVSGSDDATVRLWEVSTGKCVRIFDELDTPISLVSLSANGRFIFVVSNTSSVSILELDWKLEAKMSDDWNSDAQHLLGNFLNRHLPYGRDLQSYEEIPDDAVAIFLTRQGNPAWTEEDFQNLVQELQHAGFGWLRPEGVRHELKKMAANWDRLPSLPEIKMEDT